MPIRFEALGSHDRSAFASGEAELDEWFRTRAGQDQRRGIARVFVAVDDAGAVVGFYSLSSFSLALEDLPDDVARKLPRYTSIPAVLIGRLGRDTGARGRGVGELLLGDAFLRVTQAAQHMGVFAIAVDPKNDGAAAFYGRFGFRPMRGTELRMFVPMATAAAAVEGALNRRI